MECFNIIPELSPKFELRKAYCDYFHSPPFQSKNNAHKVSYRKLENLIHNVTFSSPLTSEFENLTQFPPHTLNI